MIITGYRIKSTDLNEIELKLAEVKQILEKTSKTLFHKKLGEEIAFLSDNIALNILQRDENQSIYDSALMNTTQAIRIAGITGADVDYNLQVYAHLMILDDYTYLKVICPNTKLLKAFKHLDSYCLSESECQDKQNAKAKTWQKLHGLYELNEPLSLNLTQDIAPDKALIKYPDLNERCEIQARYNIQNRLLNQISGGDQIPPFRLMNYFDIALSALDNPDIKSDLAQKKMELANILPDLSKDDSFIFDEEKDDE